MLTDINAIKVYKSLYIYAIIYDFFYWIKKNQYFMILFHMYSTKFPKAANFRAQMWPLMPDFLVIWFGFQKEVLF